MNFKGVTEMTQKLLDIALVSPEMVMKAMYQEAQIEVVEMKKRCPVDTSVGAPHPGNLRASIHAERPTKEGRKLVQMFATGVQAPYAVYVHENPDALHKIGQWKFMESVLNESRPYYAARVGARINLNKAL